MQDSRSEGTQHLAFVNAPCPCLPDIERVITAAEILALGKDRGPVFYEASLRYAQSQWRMGFPAQALLQVNRALSTCLDADEPVLKRLPLPYASVVWLLVNRIEGQFIGNPRRHFQHLATRMVEPHKELRVWRAWACWYLAKTVLTEADSPADMKQIRQEGIVEPTFAQIAEKLQQLSPANDHEMLLQALGVAKPHHASQPHTIIEPIGMDQLPVVRALAYAIWPRVYPGIISEEQIHYMLEQRYDIGVLGADLEDKGVCFALIQSGDQDVGFVAFEPREQDGEAFLHKLYLLPEFAGQGLGAKALQWVTEQSQARGLKRIRLFVNKHNTSAIRAYLRQGFVFQQDVVTDIGNGFVMDDFIMAKVLDYPPSSPHYSPS